VLVQRFLSFLGPVCVCLWSQPSPTAEQGRAYREPKRATKPDDFTVRRGPLPTPSSGSGAGLGLVAREAALCMAT
jgi:hypothetical protein